MKARILNNPISFFLFVIITDVVFSLLYNTHLILNNYHGQYAFLAMVATILMNAAIWYLFALNRWLFLILCPLFFMLGAGFNFFIKQLHINMSIWVFEILFNTNVNEAVGVINRSVVLEVFIGFVIAMFFVLARFYLGHVGKLRYMAISAVVLVVFVIIGRFCDDSYLQYARVNSKGADTGKGLDTMPSKIIENLYHQSLNTYRFKSLAKRHASVPAPIVSDDNDNMTVILILTDALRPDHMQIKGYDRPTTPNMVKDGFILFNDMYACQTSTTKSVPCLTTRGSRMNIPGYIDEVSILSMFKAAGFDTAWISSQASVSTSDTGASIVANDADFVFYNTNMNNVGRPVYDFDLLPIMDEFIKRPNGKKFIVLHLNGSHWNYITRYSDEFKEYTPECSKWIYDCTVEEVVNTYDNTIHATDKLFDDVVKRIDNKKSIIFFTSDHGQFLGENGVFLHTHNMMDSKELVVVPFGIWTSKYFDDKTKLKNILANRDKITNHDNVFYSVTDCAGLKSDLITDNMSVCSDKFIETPRQFK